MKPALIVSTRDNVATALERLDAGRQLVFAGTALTVRDSVPAGHKVAIRSIPVGSPVIKYGNEIGIATTDISVGTHVHTHNVASSRGRGDVEVAAVGHTWSNE